jgi:hypothetical protein
MAVRAGEVMMGAEAREEARENAGTVGIVLLPSLLYFHDKKYRQLLN